MNRKEQRRFALSLLRREEHIHNRFLAPNLQISAWNPAALDMAASYVGLLHAESEGTLESAVRNVLEHAVACANHGYAHPVLVNALVHYQAQIFIKMGKIRLVAKRSLLERDPALLHESWRQSGAAAFWSNALDSNHGTGLTYVERLVQPLGLDLGTASFKPLAGAGVKSLATMPSGNLTDLTEFVSLRGRAMHAGVTDFHSLVKSMTPSEIRQSGRRAVVAISNVSLSIANSLW